MDNVKLISITQPRVPGMKSAEDLIAYCARVSNPSNQSNTETAPRLIAYLIKHKHWSPFEMISMTVQIRTSRAIAAQILRHRSFSFQEFSQRYAQATNILDVELRKQGATNRQVGDEVFDPRISSTSDGLLNYPASELIQKHNQRSIELYNELVETGVARECARMVLPLSTETTLYMSGTCRSWIHYLDLRSDEHTQKEHRDIANACKAIFKEQLPLVSSALNF